MNSLDSKITALLTESVKLLRPRLSQGSRWVATGKRAGRRETVLDEEQSWNLTFADAWEQIEQLQSFSVAEKAFQRDSVFSRAPKVAGWWGTFPQIVKQLIQWAGCLNGDFVTIDLTGALRYFGKLRDTFSARHLNFEASARLLGVNLSRKELLLSDGIRIVRLTMKERNERQLLNTTFRSEWMLQRLLSHPVELRVAFVVPVDTSQEGALFKAHNSASSIAEKHFEKVKNAVLLTTHGEAVLRHLVLKGGLEAITMGEPLETQLPPFDATTLRQSKLENLAKAYSLVSEDTNTDKILVRSIHRFVLGRQRTNHNDRLIDYVTAWETILLTQNRTAAMHELSYRFAVNGSSLISRLKGAQSPIECYRKMKAAYAVRSEIVHGAAGGPQSKTLRSGEFSNVDEVCNYLESKFREIVFLLADFPHGGRPYQRQNGWEELLWPEGNASQPDG